MSSMVRGLLFCSIAQQPHSTVWALVVALEEESKTLNYSVCTFYCCQKMLKFSEENVISLVYVFLQALKAYCKREFRVWVRMWDVWCQFAPLTSHIWGSFDQTYVSLINSSAAYVLRHTSLCLAQQYVCRADSEKRWTHTHRGFAPSAMSFGTYTLRFIGLWPTAALKTGEIYVINPTRGSSVDQSRPNDKQK